MSIEDDLIKIAQQESELQFRSFNQESAWRLGDCLRKLALERNHSIVIDIRRFGQQLFFCAVGATTPDNSDWVRRKTNTTARFLRSSYAVGLSLDQKQTTIMAKYALPEQDYVTHGGSFPIAVRDTGAIGIVTVSGLDQRADHELVVEALCAELGESYSTYKLINEE